MPMPLKNACTVPRGEALSKNEVVEEHVDARPMEFGTHLRKQIIFAAMTPKILRIGF